MCYLEDPAHHQNTIYSATGPAALYVAVALQDPRTATVLPSRERGEYPLRAAMLDWIESVTNAVGNDAEAIRERLGFSLERDPESVQVRALRPALFRAVSPLLHDADLAVREAAIAAAVSLLDAPELVQHRATLTPLVREVLAASAKRSHRYVARRTAEGMTKKDIVRCLKRFVAREVYHHLPPLTSPLNSSHKPLDDL